MPELTVRGIYKDELLDAGGHVLFDSGWKSNLIVLRCRMLIAGFMKNEAKVLGIQTLQFGRGLESWDANPPPAPDPLTTTLVDKTPFILSSGPSLVLQYLDSSDNLLVAGPSTRIQIVATLGPGEPAAVTGNTYPLREFGLFGKLGDQDFMIDYVVHAVIQKDITVTLERKIRLIF